MIYLYVKQHNKTGLKYFGKTIQNPYKYKGSGTYWKSHCKIHGDDIKTVSVYAFLDEAECIAFANTFSLEHNIDTSNEWANLIPENVVGDKRHKTAHRRTRRSRGPMSDEQKRKISISRTGIKHTKPSGKKGKTYEEIFGEEIGKIKREQVKIHFSCLIRPPVSDETRNKISNALTGQIRGPKHSVEFKERQRLRMTQNNPQAGKLKTKNQIEFCRALGKKKRSPETIQRMKLAATERERVKREARLL